MDVITEMPGVFARAGTMFDLLAVLSELFSDVFLHFSHKVKQADAQLFVLTLIEL